MTVTFTTSIFYSRRTRFSTECDETSGVHMESSLPSYIPLY